MQTSTNRRGALMSLAKAAAATTALSVACGVSQCTTKANAATIDRTAWGRAYANMERTKAAAQAFQPTHDAAVKGFERDKPSGVAIDLRPLAFLIDREQRWELLHRDDLDRLHANYIAAQGKTWFSVDPEANIARHKAACDQVRQFRRDYQAAKDQHSYDAVTQRGDELAEAAYNAAWALFKIPAPDLKALDWKLRHLLATEVREDDYCPSWVGWILDTVLADSARLLRGEA